MFNSVEEEVIYMCVFFCSFLLYSKVTGEILSEEKNIFLQI